MLNSYPFILTEQDGGIALVVTELNKIGGHPPVILAPSKFGNGEYTTSITWSMESGTVVRIQGPDVPNDAVITAGTRVWRRRPGYPGQTAPLHSDHYVHQFVEDQYRETLRAIYQADCDWMNPWAAERALDQNKILGARLAAASGLRPIPTLYTDDRDTYLKFIDRYADNGFALKMPSAWAARLDKVDGDAIGIYTNRLTACQARDLGDSVPLAPIIIQPYVAKLFELRVTVVGSEVWACRIDSQAVARTAVDWRRYDLENVTHQEFNIGDELRAKLIDFVRRAGLLFAAIDMIVTPERDVLFVEANPAGQYSWVEALTGMPISRSIARWLSGS